jgi:hypothetical protein
MECNKDADIIEDIFLGELKDEEAKNWDKQSIRYVTENTDEVMSSIRRLVKKICKVPVEEDDIYMMLVEKLYETNDYDIGRAINKETGTIMSISDFVRLHIKYIILSEHCKRSEISSREISYVANEDDETNIFDIIAWKDNTEQPININYSVKDICKHNEHTRYIYGVDIFQLWAVCILARRYDKTEKLKYIMSALCIESKNVEKILRSHKTEEIVEDMVRAIEADGIEKAITDIKEYVYAFDKIDEIIKTI